MDRRKERPARKRGETLAELCVVMAVIAIIGTMTISFCIVLRNNARLAISQNQVMEEMDNWGKTFRAWVSQFDSESYSFATDGNTLYAICSDGTEYSLVLTENNILLGNCPDGSAMSSVASSVRTVEYRLIEHRDPSEQSLLVDCRVSYQTFNFAGNREVLRQALFLKTLYAASKGERNEQT